MPKAILKKLAAFLILFVFWMLLTFSLDPGFIIVGVILSAAVVYVMSGVYPEKEWLLNPVRWFWLLVYVPYFLYFCTRANLDVAYRVLHPDVPIQPGIVKVKTELTTRLAKTFLANSITLTPGTLTVDIDGEEMYIHWINVTTEDAEERTEVIVRRFEGLLKRIFE